MGFRYLIAEPRDALATYRGRVLCRLFRVHGRACAGRAGHIRRYKVHRWMRRVGW